MNAFYEHHKNNIQFGYRCFDRLLLNGLIQPFQQPERVLGFFNAYREGKRVTKKLLTEMAMDDDAVVTDHPSARHSRKQVRIDMPSSIERTGPLAEWGGRKMDWQRPPRLL